MSSPHPALNGSIKVLLFNYWEKCLIDAEFSLINIIFEAFCFLEIKFGFWVGKHERFLGQLELLQHCWLLCKLYFKMTNTITDNNCRESNPHLSNIFFLQYCIYFHVSSSISQKLHFSFENYYLLHFQSISIYYCVVVIYTAISANVYNCRRLGMIHFLKKIKYKAANRTSEDIKHTEKWNCELKNG